MDITINGRNFRTGTLNAFTQLHVSRRLAPLLPKLTALIDGVGGADDGLLRALLAGEEQAAEKVSANDLNALLVPLAAAATVLPDADVEFIINACLDVTGVKQAGGAYAPMRTNGLPMFPVSAPEMLGIAFAALKENMTDFFTGLSSLSSLGGLMSRRSG